MCSILYNRLQSYGKYPTNRHIIPSFCINLLSFSVDTLSLCIIIQCRHNEVRLQLFPAERLIVLSNSLKSLRQRLPHLLVERFCIVFLRCGQFAVPQDELDFLHA